jgi:dGTPase
MELADDIAYGVHDLEDGIALQLISHEIWMEAEDKLDRGWMKDNQLKDIGKELFGNSSQRKRAIGALVHAFMTNVEHSKKPGYESPLLSNQVGLTGKSKESLDILASVVIKNVIKIPEVQTLEFRGQQIVIQIFNAIASDPERFLKKAFKDTWEQATEEAQSRVICDYISGMTDEYATRMYERLFLPRHGTIFQRL